MNTKYQIQLLKLSDKFLQYFLIFILILITGKAVNADVVEISITGHWSESDFKVTAASEKLFDPLNPKFDGKVFGVAPSAGEVIFRLLVNTDGYVFFPNGSEFNATGVGAYSLIHDFYGYRDAKLVDGTFGFGSAVWKADGIIAGLEGPDGAKAALWTDADITNQEPTKLSFRMFGKADGLTADIFVGSRTHFSNGNQFVLWEYYEGETISSGKYSVKVIGKA